MTATAETVAVLCSGGLDSAVLLVEMGRAAGHAVPVFVRAGHVWEDAEREALGRFLAAVGEPRIGTVRELSVPMHDLYGADWSMTGRGAPAWEAPDEAVVVRGRNLVLLSKTLILAAIESWPKIALGSLDRNPFRDATPEFFASLAAAASAGLGVSIEITAPFRTLAKVDVIRRGAGLPLHLTLSCLRPAPDGAHCGDCNKCRERAAAFTRAAVPDLTRYNGPAGRR